MIYLFAVLCFAAFCMSVSESVNEWFWEQFQLRKYHLD